MTNEQLIKAIEDALFNAEAELDRIQWERFRNYNPESEEEAEREFTKINGQIVEII